MRNITDALDTSKMMGKEIRMILFEEARIEQLEPMEVVQKYSVDFTQSYRPSTPCLV
ncbi:MAG: hypothetical protein R2773_07250 [Flavobacteriaceae bacterium]